MCVRVGERVNGWVRESRLMDTKGELLYYIRLSTRLKSSNSIRKKEGGGRHLAATLSGASPDPKRQDKPGVSKKNEPNTKNCCTDEPEAAVPLVVAMVVVLLLLLLYMTLLLYPPLPLPIPMLTPMFMPLPMLVSTPGEGKLYPALDGEIDATSAGCS